MASDDTAALAHKWMDAVRSKSRGRTRYEGQEPFWDEAVLEYIERLKAALEKIAEGAYRSEVSAIAYAALKETDDD